MKASTWSACRPKLIYRPLPWGIYPRWNPIDAWWRCDGGAWACGRESSVCGKKLPTWPSLLAIRAWRINVTSRGGVHPSPCPRRQTLSPPRLPLWTRPDPHATNIITLSLRFRTLNRQGVHELDSTGIVPPSQVTYKWMSPTDWVVSYVWGFHCSTGTQILS